MQAFTEIEAIAAALPMDNVDTDKILPARFLRTISREGLGKALFWALRQEPDFTLNRSPWDKAGILVTLQNFGCGSSREHAPWALLDFGIRCVIAPSIADIFYNNCCKNGILPIILPLPDVRDLIALASNPATAKMKISLPAQEIRTADNAIYAFDIDPARKADLLAGIDEIARSLEQEDRITSFENRQSTCFSWLADTRIAAPLR